MLSLKGTAEEGKLNCLEFEAITIEIGIPELVPEIAIALIHSIWFHRLATCKPSSLVSTTTTSTSETTPLKGSQASLNSSQSSNQNYLCQVGDFNLTTLNLTPVNPDPKLDSEIRKQWRDLNADRDFNHMELDDGVARVVTFQLIISYVIEEASGRMLSKSQSETFSSDSKGLVKSGLSWLLNSIGSASKRSLNSSSRSSQRPFESWTLQLIISNYQQTCGREMCLRVTREQVRDALVIIATRCCENRKGLRKESSQYPITFRLIELQKEK